MVYYIPVILVCLLSTPDYACKEGNKGVSVTVLYRTNTPYACFSEAMEKVATLAYIPTLGEKYYTRIKCVPRDSGLDP